MLCLWGTSARAVLYQNIQVCRLTNEPQLRSGSDATPPVALMAEISARSWGGMSDTVLDLCGHHVYTCKMHGLAPYQMLLRHGTYSEMYDHAQLSTKLAALLHASGPAARDT
jgi:hypothetical protein